MHLTLERTPPELAADIVDRGIMLVGGGSLLRDFDQVLRSETKLPILRSEDPFTAVVHGAGKALEDLRAAEGSRADLERRHAAGRRRDHEAALVVAARIGREDEEPGAVRLVALRGAGHHLAILEHHLDAAAEAGRVGSKRRLTRRVGSPLKSRTK